MEQQLVVLTPSEIAAVVEAAVKRALGTSSKPIPISNKPDRYLSYTEVMGMFVPAISKTTLYSWIKKGRLKPVIIEGRRFIKESDLTETLLKTKKPS